MENIQEMTYEQCIEALDDIITRLEDNALSLKESVALFEKGSQLFEQANVLLTAAEAQVEFLNQNTFESKDNDILEKAVQDTMFD